MLELYAVKVACMVLRGEGSHEALDLLGCSKSSWFCNSKGVMYGRF